MGRLVIYSATTTIKAGNALVARYDRELWFRIAPILDFLFEDKWSKALEILQEGEVASDHAITVSSLTRGSARWETAFAFVFVASSRQPTFVRTFRRGFLDMPFDGDHILGKAVVESIKTIKTDTEMARALDTLQQ